jgi:hypothetical protein
VEASTDQSETSPKTKAHLARSRISSLTCGPRAPAAVGLGEGGRADAHADPGVTPLRPFFDGYPPPLPSSSSDTTPEGLLPFPTDVGLERPVSSDPSRLPPDVTPERERPPEVRGCGETTAPLVKSSQRGFDNFAISSYCKLRS